MRGLKRVSWLLLVVVATGACGESPPPTELPPTLTIDTELRRSIAMWGVVPILPMQEQNRAQVELGRALMFDRILSGNRDVSCASCHDPARQGGDGLSLAVGTGGTGVGVARHPGPGRQFMGRNAPSLLNVGLGSFYMFWDARLAQGWGGHVTTPIGFPRPAGVSDALVAQAFFPVVSREEMRGHPGDVDVFGNPNELAALGDNQFEEIWRAVMRRVLAIPEYVTKFASAFPSTPASSISYQHAATAIATFERDAYTAFDSPFDRYLGRNDGALTLAQKRGGLLFFGTKAQCSSCHAGPLLGSQRFANIGIPQFGPGSGSGAPLDFGVGETFNIPQYRFAFRVPSLRNVALTAPYMHNGAYPTLEAVVRHYKDVPRSLREYDVTQIPEALRGSYHGDPATIDAILSTLDFGVREPRDLSDEEVADIVAFLESLTDPAARDLGRLVPERVPSGLPVR